MDLYNKYSKTLRLTYELDSAANRVFSGSTAIDNEKKITLTMVLMLTFLHLIRFDLL